jgi:hypothetical protein
MATSKKSGSLTGLKASNKRVGPVDAKGAWTKVQEKTLAGAKGKATLKKDKQLGATKMKMGGKIAKSGGSFPDLNKDGKITQADILKGRGVIAKSGTSMKKCKYGCK